VNIVFFGIIALSCLVAAFTGSMDAVTKGALDGAKGAVELAISLVGVMTLFLGLMQVVQEAGGLKAAARVIRPIMIRLFPDVPTDHPAMGAMIMNLAANALGLGNAATPFGIRAMQELDKLNGKKGTATNAMALFLTINTAHVTLLPTGVIAVRAAAGSKAAAAILPSTLFATACSTTFGVLFCILLSKLRSVRKSQPPILDGRELPAPGTPANETAAATPAAPEPSPSDLVDLSAGQEGRGSLIPFFGVIVALAALVGLAIAWGDTVSAWLIPMLILAMVSVGLVRGIKVYEVFVAGAKDGFNVAIRIVPYLVAILVAVGMFRASGALDQFVAFVGPWTTPIGLAPEAIPMVLLRPLSGSGAFAYMSEVVKNTGPDTYAGYLVSTLQGSSETTFYVLAVYFGAIGVTRYRHTLAAALLADLFGYAGAIFVCRLLFT
jgi:spore maturation protein SpmA